MPLLNPALPLLRLLPVFYLIPPINDYRNSDHKIAGKVSYRESLALDISRLKHVTHLNLISFLTI